MNAAVSSLMRPIKPRATEDRQAADWVLSDAGKPVPNLANAVSALRDLFPAHFKFDEMNRIPMLMKPLASHSGFTSRPNNRH